MAQQQTGLTCVAAAEATVKWKGNSTAAGGDPVIPPTTTFTPQGLSARCWA